MIRWILSSVLYSYSQLYIIHLPLHVSKTYYLLNLKFFLGKEKIFMWWFDAAKPILQHGAVEFMTDLLINEYILASNLSDMNPYAI